MAEMGIARRAVLHDRVVGLRNRFDELRSEAQVDGVSSEEEVIIHRLADKLARIKSILADGSVPTATDLPQGLGHAPEAETAATGGAGVVGEDVGEGEAASTEEPLTNEEDDEDDIAAAAGDLDALLNAIRKKTYYFAFFNGNPPALKAHRRRALKTLAKQARRESGGSHGAWGVLAREAKSVIFACQNDPPKTIARAAKLYFKDRGHSLRVIVQSPAGQVIEDADTTDGAPSTSFEIPEQGDRVQPESPGVSSSATSPATGAASLQMSADEKDYEDDEVVQPPPPMAQAAYGAFKVMIEPGEDYTNAELFERAYTQYFASKGMKYSDQQISEWLAREKAKGIKLVSFSDRELLEIKLARKDHIWLDIVPLGVTVLEDEDARDLRALWDEIPPERQAQINAHVDKQFYERMDYPEGEKIKSPKEKAAEAWRALQAQAVLDETFRRGTSERGQKFLLFGKRGISLNADNVKIARQIAGYADRLTEDELADFWARHDTRRMTIEQLDEAMRRYYFEMSRRRDVKDAYDGAHHDLAGQDQLAALHSKAHSLDHLEHNPAAAAVYWLTKREEVEAVLQARKDLAAEMEKWPDYASEADFEKALRAYGKRMANEAVKIVEGRVERRKVELARFRDEMLHDTNVESMFNALEHVRERRAVIDEKTPSGPTQFDKMRDHFERLGDPEKPELYENAFQKAKDLVELRALLAEAAKTDPDIDRVLGMLSKARADGSAAVEVMDIVSQAKSPRELTSKLRAMTYRQEDAMDDAMGVLDKNPEAVLKFDAVMAGVKAGNGVAEGSVHAAGIAAYQKEIEDEEAQKDGLIMAGAIVLGLFTMGKGTIAVMAGIGATGLSAYGVADAVGDYNDGKAAYEAGLSSVEPSLTWVVVSIVALGLDALGLGAAAKSASKGARVAGLLAKGQPVGDAVRSYTSKMKSFKGAEDLERALEELASDLRPLVGSGEGKLSQSAVDAIIAAARNEGEINLAWTGLRGSVAAEGKDLLELPIDALANKMAATVALLQIRGIQHVDGFLRSPAAEALFPNLKSFTPDQLNKLKDGWKAASQKNAAALKRAADQGLTDADIAAKVEDWAKMPDLTPDQFAEHVIGAAPKAGVKVTDLVVDDVSRKVAAKGLPPDAPVGTVGQTVSKDEAEVLKLYYAARENSPNREVAVSYNRKTKQYILVQGDKKSVPHASRGELEKTFGKDHPMFDSDAWEPQNWETPFHTHPMDAAGKTPDYSKVASDVDLEGARFAADKSGRLTGGNAQYKVGDEWVNFSYHYDPRAKLFAVSGLMPPASGKGPWVHQTRYFETADEFAHEIYPKVGASIDELDTIPDAPIPKK